MPVTRPHLPDHRRDAFVGGDHLDVAVREIMTPGVVSIVEDASLDHVYGAMGAHGVHAVLVVGLRTGKPLGWATDRGLLGWMSGDLSLLRARDAITERARTIEPGASARDALLALSQPDTTHLLVSFGEETLPEGVISAANLISLVRT